MNSLLTLRDLMGLGHEPGLAPQPARQGAAALAHHAVQIGLLAALEPAKARRHQACHLVGLRPDLVDAHACPPSTLNLPPLAPIRQWR